jgi:hypothetical protein
MSKKPKKARSLMMILVSALSCLFGPTSQCTSVATPQVTDTVVWGGASFHIRQLPFQSALEKYETMGRLVKSSSTNSHRGYVAKWLVSDGAIYLWQLKGVRKNSKKKILENLGAVRFPVKAEWYSGTLQLPVGEFDDTSFSWPIVIELTIENGNIKNTLMLKDGSDLD